MQAANYYATMLAFRLLPLVVILVGCQSAPQSLEDAIVAETLSQLHAPESLLDGWRIEMKQDHTSACGGRGCTSFETKTIKVDATGSDGSVAELLCHETVHVYLMAETGDSDPTHRRQDLFGYEHGACSRVIAAFGGL